MVVQLHVEDDGDLGRVLVEAAVALVRLRDEDLPGALVRVGAGALQVAADRVRGVQPQVGETDGEHRGGRRLAVRAGHGQRPQPRHQRGQRVGAVQHREAAPVGLDQLGVVLADRAGDDHRRGVRRQMRAGVPHMDGHPEAAQRVGRRGLACVTARDPRTAHRQDLRDTGHPRAADPDEVRPLHGGGEGGGGGSGHTDFSWLARSGAARARGRGRRGTAQAYAVRAATSRDPRPLRAGRPACLRCRRAPEARGPTGLTPRCARTASAPERPPCAGPGRPSPGGRTPPPGAGRSAR